MSRKRGNNYRIRTGGLAEGKQKALLKTIVFYCRNDTEIRIIFLDCGRSLNTFRMFLFIAAFNELLGFLAVCVF